MAVIAPESFLILLKLYNFLTIHLRDIGPLANKKLTLVNQNDIKINFQGHIKKILLNFFIVYKQEQYSSNSIETEMF